MQNQDLEVTEDSNEPPMDPTTDPVTLLIYGNLRIRDIETDEIIVNKRF